MSARSSGGRVVLIVLDSVGCGALPDASGYGDEGADTLGHVAEAVGGLSLPNLARLGLGNVHTIRGVSPAAVPTGLWGKMAEASTGKDTTTGHWEIAGLPLPEPFAVFPSGFPEELIAAFSQRVGRGIIGNRAASGTVIIDQLGVEHMRSGDLIVYTSADSVFQIAAHEHIVTLEELYSACRIARDLCDEQRIARVIARPFLGEPGEFRRTYNRRDFSMLPPGETMLDRLSSAGVNVIGVGKIGDIFAGRGIGRSHSTHGNTEGMRSTLEICSDLDSGLLFVNLIDFDMLFGHRNDPRGYASALEEFDAFLPGLLDVLAPADRLFVTADHGCDPTHPGTDHTREYVPLLVAGSDLIGASAGTRTTYADVAETVLAYFGLPPMGTGRVVEGALRDSR